VIFTKALEDVKFGTLQVYECIDASTLSASFKPTPVLFQPGRISFQPSTASFKTGTMEFETAVNLFYFFGFTALTVRTQGILLFEF